MTIQRLVWAITNKCNFSCQFCYASSGPSEPIGISTKEALTLVDQINHSTVTSLSIIGGEPFIRSDLGEIVAALNSNISVGIDTNGSLIPERWTDAFQEKISRVSIGIDGPPDINEHYRKHTLKVIESIKWLVKNKIKVVTTILVSSKNYDQLPKTIEFLLSIGVTRIQLNKYFPVFGRSNSHQIQMSTAQENLAIQSILSLIKNSPEIKEIIQFNTWFNTAHFDNFRVDQKLGSCFCGIWSAAIAYDGAIVPCLHITQKHVLDFFRKNTTYDIPNIKTHDFRTVMTESSLFKDVGVAAVTYLPEKCAPCKFKNRCSHGCKVDAFLASNLWNENPPNCQLSREETND